MSTTLPSSLPPGAGESQHQHHQQQVVVKVKVEQNGCNTPNTPNTPNATKPEESGVGVGVGVVVPGEQPAIVVATVPAATAAAAVKSNNNAGFAVARDTSSIPGISMLAGQSYPAAVFKHDEVVGSKEVFADALNQFHSVLGTRLTKKGRGGRERAAEVKTFQESLSGIPKLGGNDLDLHLLYVEVTSRGGLEQVIKDRKWKEVTNCFKFPDTTTSASYVLRKYYVGLLYYFEQAYFFGKQGALVPPPISMPGPSPMGVKRKDASLGLSYPLSEGTPGFKRTRKRKILPMQAMPVVDPALSIGLTGTGSIEGKFEHGFLVTVTVGTEKLRGVLYHVPPLQRAPQHASVPNYAATLGAEIVIPREEINARGTRRKRRRNEDMPKKDPNAPRPNRTGYNFFFAEQRARLKALHPEKDRELSRMIGDAWNSLTEEEKLPYQDRGVKDKERYKKEIREYRELLKLHKGVIPPGMGMGKGSAKDRKEEVEEDDAKDEKEEDLEEEEDMTQEDVKEVVVKKEVIKEVNVKLEDSKDVKMDVTDVAVAEASVKSTTDGSHNFLAAMDIEIEPRVEAVPRQQEHGSNGAGKPLLDISMHELPVSSPYVTPEEQRFDAERLEGEDLSEDAFD